MVVGAGASHHFSSDANFPSSVWSLKVRKILIYEREREREKERERVADISGIDTRVY